MVASVRNFVFATTEGISLYANTGKFNTFKYHVFAPMGRFQLESIYLYFPPSSQLLKNTTAGTTVENKGKLILREIHFKETSALLTDVCVLYEHHISCSYS
jgi:hypothetical protein